MSCRTTTSARLFGLAAASLSLLTGCFETRSPLEYIGNEPLQYYEDQATRIDDPLVHQVSPEEIVATGGPRTIADRSHDELWDMSLAEAIHIALKNATVIRTAGTFRSVGNPILSNPAVAPTIYDPAIQSSSVLAGRGVEAALADFDTDFVSSMTWGRNEQVQNSPFSPAGFGVILPTVATETGNFAAGLTKDTATGGQISLTHQMNYSGVPPGLFPFPSSYAGNVTVGYRQPLWAGSGVEYTRIAGPIGTQTQLTQNVVGEGVVLARINQNVSLEDFENNVRNLALDVENLYWDLHLQYRLYRTAVVARNSSLEQWRNLKTELDVGGIRGRGEFLLADEAQARDAYFEARAQAELALGFIYTIETRLRRLLGLPVNDGRIIRPSDEPLTAEVDEDWHLALATALNERVELRKQKWNVKSLELQLTAAKNLVNPRLDFVSGYNVNAFGDQLWGLGSDADAVGSPQGLRYAYESLTQGNQTGWTLGFELSMPLGFRHAHSQVRNYELRLVKARELLAAQELEISHELAVAFQDVARLHQQARSNFNRRRAAKRQLDVFDDFVAEGAGGIDVNDRRLRAIRSLALAEQNYFTSLADYNKALADLQYRKGMLLEFNNIYLSEGDWDPAAYEIALRRAKARSHATDAGNLLHAEPADFAVPRGEAAQLYDGIHHSGPIVPEDFDVRDIPLDGTLPTPADGGSGDGEGTEGIPKAPPALDVPDAPEAADDAPLRPIPEPEANEFGAHRSAADGVVATEGWTTAQPHDANTTAIAPARFEAPQATEKPKLRSPSARENSRPRSAVWESSLRRARRPSGSPVVPLFGAKPVDAAASDEDTRNDP